MLADARTWIARYTPDEARADPDLHIPRSVLPWRTDELARQRVCLVCAHGYSPSLAAALLVELGVDAGDLIGGFAAW